MITRELSSVVLVWSFDVPISPIDYHSYKIRSPVARAAEERQLTMRKDHAVTNDRKTAERVPPSVAFLLVPQIRHNEMRP